MRILLRNVWAKTFENFQSLAFAVGIALFSHYQTFVIFGEGMGVKNSFFTWETISDLSSPGVAKRCFPGVEKVAKFHITNSKLREKSLTKS